MPIPSDVEITDRLFEVARARARQLGLEFRPDAQHLLHGFIAGGAHNIVLNASSKKADEVDSYYATAMRIASESVNALVDEMATQRHRIDGYLASHGETLGEETFFRAQSILCPLWPFC